VNELFYQGHGQGGKRVCFALSGLSLNKPPKFKPTGKLHPIRPAANPWNLVTMDFIVKLPPSTPSRGMKPESQVYDSILTITDKLTRLVRLVPGREDWTAKEWAQAYFTEIYPTLGMSKSE
jgi:hypothetical protein